MSSAISSTTQNARYIVSIAVKLFSAKLAGKLIFRSVEMLHCRIRIGKNASDKWLRSVEQSVGSLSSIMAERTQARIDRARERKMANKPGWRPVPGRSILQMMQDRLDEEMRKYLEMRKQEWILTETLNVQRGLVKGIALGVGIMQWPYLSSGGEGGDGTGGDDGCKMAERESLRRVKEMRKKREWLQEREK